MISAQQSTAVHREVKEHRGCEKRHLPPKGRAVVALACSDNSAMPVRIMTMRLPINTRLRSRPIKRADSPLKMIPKSRRSTTSTDPPRRASARRCTISTSAKSHLEVCMAWPREDCPRAMNHECKDIDDLGLSRRIRNRQWRGRRR